MTIQCFFSLMSCRRPSGNPERDLKSHIMQPKLKEKERLQLLLKQIEEDNVRLHEALVPRKQHLTKTQDKITQKLNMFEQVILLSNLCLLILLSTFV